MNQGWTKVGLAGARIGDLRALGIGLAGVGLTVGQAQAGEVEDRISGLGGATAGSAEWDAAVMAELVGAYDADRSGAIDRPPEVRKIPCGVWQALDEAVQASPWRTPFAQLYGFPPNNFQWVGQAIGISEEVRGAGWRRLKQCKVDGRPRGDNTLPEAPLGVADRIAALPDGGGSEWDLAVSQVLVESFDRNGSGTIDSAEEVDAIGCETWGALDAGVRQSWPTGIAVIYGFAANKTWVGGTLGFDESVGVPALLALEACGLGEDERPMGFMGNEMAEPEVDVSGASSPLALGLKRLPGGASSAWDAEVKALLVAALDRDGSQSLNRPEELVGIPCEAWKVLDDNIRESWRASLAQTYGFDPHFQWVGAPIGITEEMRTHAWVALGACGLAE